MPAVPAPAGGPPPDQVVEIFTDGACSPNPGPGGWGAILRFGGHAKELHGGEPDTTNNRMELMAAIQGLEHLTRRSAVHVYTDSVGAQMGAQRLADRGQEAGQERRPVAAAR